ncbi:secreted protein [Candidatus Magnetobacterium bavaricum]|uniref:Secreted protein n=1 Tax=Candidatus Magnetobacterium bavaricum TaxID=29290 RepID=A0A0F3GQ38_9BACT|nr:secreted protein [Candidatus Magnetobacterium bavaricum]
MFEKMKEILAVVVFVLLLIVSLPLSAYPDALDNWHWRSPFPVSSGKNLKAVSFGNNTFVVVGEKGTILTSPDGVTWTYSGLKELTDGGVFKGFSS